MLSLRPCTLYVITLLYVIHGQVGQHCDIGVFYATPSDNLVAGESTITLTCETTTKSCKGTLKISGAELTKTVKDYGTYYLSTKVEITKSGSQTYKCQFVYAGRTYTKRTYLQVQPALPCNITDFSSIQLSNPSQYSLSCTTTCTAHIQLYGVVGSSLDIIADDTTTVIKTTVMLDTYGVFQYYCVIVQDNAGEEPIYRLLEIENKRICGITYFERMYYTNTKSNSNVQLKCNTNCSGVIHMVGPDKYSSTSTVSSETGGSMVRYIVGLTTSKAGEYYCSFTINDTGESFTEAVTVDVECPAPTISSSSTSVLVGETFTLMCENSCGGGNLRLTMSWSADAMVDSLLKSTYTDTLSYSISRDTTGDATFNCSVLIGNSVTVSENHVVTVQPYCGITAFKAMDQNDIYNYIQLQCSTNCAGDVRLAGPDRYESSGTIFSKTGDDVSRYISFTDTTAQQKSGVYYCYFESELTSRNFTETTTVNINCPGPTMSTSSTWVLVGEEFTVTCDDACGSGIMGLWMSDEREGAMLTSTYDTSLSYILSREVSGGIRLTCDRNDRASSSYYVNVQDCEIGESFIECGTSCDVISCDDDVTRQSYCEQNVDCEGKCRCPEERPYWFEGSCVTDCGGDPGEVSGMSASVWWIVVPLVIILVITGVIVILVITLCKACKRKPPQQPSQPTAAKKQPTVTKNKQAEYFEADDGIQYSDEEPDYDYDHYVRPSLEKNVRPSAPGTSLPPPALPSAPMPTIDREHDYNDPVALQIKPKRAGYTNLPATLTSSRQPDDLEISRIKFSESNVLYENTPT